jgi:hypothetical protein
MLRDAGVVDEGAEARSAVAQDASIIVEGQLGVIARDVGVEDLEVGRRPAADGEG